jgi:membrane protease YdiL (CAAX protease family)
VNAPATDPRPRWPAWYGIAALGAGLLATIVLSVLVGAVFQAAGTDVQSSPPGLVFALTVIQDICLVVAVIAFASNVSKPRPWQFGFRRSPFWRSVGWAALGAFIYLVGSLVYINAFGVHAKQTTLKDLGADQGGIVTVLIGVLVVGMAPVVEEFVFRGFLYGTLRNRLSFLPAAAIDGLIFGGIHATSGLSAVPPLMILGFAFCLIYEATGSIFPTVCLHALNNMVAFGGDKHGSWPVAGAVAGVVVIASVQAARSLRPPAVAAS